MNNGDTNKDYGEYFSAIERKIESGNTESFEKVVPLSESEIKEIIPQRQKKKRRRVNTKLFALFFLCVFLALTVAALAVFIPLSLDDNEKKNADSSEITLEPQDKIETKPIVDLYPKESANFTPMPKLNSSSAIMVKLSDNSIISSLNANERMYPASTTKLMTLLVAIEHISDLNETVSVSADIVDFMYKEGATVAGYVADEEVSYNDLLYGLILPSGGDAALAICNAIAGGEEDFVKLMNEKVRSLNLKNTNFANSTGLHHTNHYSSVTDMSIILSEVLKNSTAKKIISTYKYKAQPTNKHPEGLDLTSTLFSYMYGTEPKTATILGGKTGWVSESGYCIASYGTPNGSSEEYICVTFNARSRYPAVYDHIDIFAAFAK